MQISVRKSWLDFGPREADVFNWHLTHLLSDMPGPTLLREVARSADHPDLSDILASVKAFLEAARDSTRNRAGVTLTALHHRHVGPEQGYSIDISIWG